MTNTNDTTPKLSKKEEQMRAFILDGSMFQVILKIGLPIAFFQGVNNLLRVLDSFMAASIDATAASMVSFFGQINLIIGGLGLGLAVGGSLKISQMYGQGHYDMVKRQVNSLYFFGVALCSVLALIVLPLTTPVLALLNTPQVFIEQGRTYFTTEFISTMLAFLNGIYVALERVQGNTKRIMRVNLMAMCFRLSFTAFSVYVLHQGVNFIALSNLLSQLFIFGFGLYSLHGKSQVFSLSPRAISFSRAILWPMIGISIPIMVERSAFHVGKTIMNGMILFYGPLYIGAAGISNQICAVTVSQQMGFQDAGVSVGAQNLGAQRFGRVIEAFKAIMLINAIQTIIFFIPMFLFARQLTGLFALEDPVFHEILYSVFVLDVWSVLALALYAAVNALLLGLGYTKLTLILNFCRVFLFRIPVLWFLQNFTDMQGRAVGFVFVFSNVMVTLVALFMAGEVLRRFCRKHELSFVSLVRHSST